MLAFAAMVDKSAKSRRKRMEILRSAAAVFRKRGYYGASIDEIAGALKMTKASLYYYFKNKEEMLYSCHHYSLSLLLGLLDKVRTEYTAPEDQLRTLIRYFVRLIIDDLHGTALTGDMGALTSGHRRKIVAMRDEFDKGLRLILERGMEAGVFRRTDPKLAAFAILGAVNWIPRWFDPRGPAHSDEIADAFTHDLIDGLLNGSPNNNQAEPLVS